MTIRFDACTGVMQNNRPFASAAELILLCVLNDTQIPQKMPQYRQQRDHLQFLTDLKTKFGSMEEVEERLRSRLDNVFDDIQEVSAGQHDGSLEFHVKTALGDRNLIDISRTKFVDL